MTRPNEPDMSLKYTKQVQLGIYSTQIQPSDHDVIAISGELAMASEWLIANLGMVMILTKFTFGD